MAARLEKLFTVWQENLRDTVEEIRVALQRDFHFRKENASKQWPVLTRCDFAELQFPLSQKERVHKLWPIRYGNIVLIFGYEQ